MMMMMMMYVHVFRVPVDCASSGQRSHPSARSWGRRIRGRQKQSVSNSPSHI